MKYFITLFILIFLISSCTSKTVEIPSVNNGYIDLSNWNFNENGAVELKGNWDFKWLNEQIDYENVDHNASDWDVLYVPSFWNHKKDIPGNGYGTLQLTIKLKNQHTGLYLKSCLSAYSLFINNEKMMSAGKYGKNKKEVIPQIKSNLIELPKIDTIMIVWKISNFHTYNGGPESVPIISDYNSLKKQYWLIDIQRAIILGIILMMAIYSFLLWIIRKKDKYNLFFCLFCIVIFLRSFVFNDFFTNIFSIPNIILFEIQYKIDFLAETLGILTFLNYIKCIFPKQVNSKLFKLANILFFFLSILILIFNAKLNVVFAILYNIVTPIAGLWLIWVIISALKEKPQEAIILLIGSIILLLTVLNDILHSQRIIYTFFLSDFGTVIMLLSQTIIISIESATNFKKIEDFSYKLEKKVKQRTQELQEANIKILEQSEQRTAFFINVAHETKTPLSLIQINFDEYFKGLKNKITPELKNIKHYITKLCRDIANLLDSEKIRRGSELYNHSQLVDISTTLNQEIALFKVAANKKNISLTCSCKDSLLCKIDPAGFEKIINNLLDNAIKYIENGNTINVTLTSNQTNIFLTVQDNGPGIPLEQQQNIFLPYYQISKKKRNIQGLGLGLSIVKHIVDSVSGNIKIESEINKGTKIIITLPEHKAAETDVITEYIPEEQVTGIINNKPGEEPYDKNKYTVFFIEDKMELITAMQKNMYKLFNFFHALDGQDALDKLESIPKPDIIISDIMMDRMDGHEFHDRLQKLEKYKNIPFIFLTAKTVQQEKEDSLAKGILDYIYKPFKMDELIKKVLALLKYRQNAIETERKIMDNKLASLIWSDESIEALKFESKCAEYGLSAREKDVVRLIMQVLPHKQIADKLNLSTSTIIKHVYQVYKKCKVHSNMELLKLFLE